MKKRLLLLLFFFSGSLDGFSQVKDTLGAPMQLNLSKRGHYTTGLAVRQAVKPDTIRAIILVTLSPNGIAHARMGFVVVQDGKRPVYLDCRKRALKLPQVGWGYQITGGEK